MKCAGKLHCTAAGPLLRLPGTAVLVILLLLSACNGREGDENGVSVTSERGTTPEGSSAEARTDSTAERVKSADGVLEELDTQIEAALNDSRARSEDWEPLDRAAALHMERALLTGAGADLARADEYLVLAAALARDNEEIILRQAELDLLLDRVDEAEGRLRRVSSPDAKLQARLTALNGDIALARGEYGAALSAYQSALEQERDQDNLLRMATYARKAADYLGAEKHYGEAIGLSDGAPGLLPAWMWMQRGQMSAERGLYQQALSEFREADTLLPGWNLNTGHIAEMQYLLGDGDEALRSFATLVEEGAGPATMHKYAELLRREGEIERADQLEAQAYESFQSLQRAQPLWTSADDLQYLLDSGRDNELALQLTQRSYAQRPAGDSALRHAQALLLSGDAEEARRVSEAMLAGSYSTARAHLLAAAIYEKLGEDALAAEQRVKALELNSHILD